MIEFITLFLPAFLSTSFFLSLDNKHTSFSIKSIGLLSWFILSNNLIIFLILHLFFGHVSTLVNAAIFNVSFTWKFLLIAIFISIVNSLFTHEMLNHISIKKLPENHEESI